MRIASVLLAFLLFASAAEAGVVYGSITRGSHAVRERPVKIACQDDDSSPYGGGTDDKGSYSINVRKQGRCKLLFEHEGQQVWAYVYSGSRPARHDFELYRDGDEWKLRRR